MNELAYHCTIYFKTDKNETMKDAAARLCRILEDIGLDYNFYDMELLDENGNTID